MLIVRGLIGLAFFCFVSWLMSSDRRKFPVRVVVAGILMQFVLAWFLLETSVGQSAFRGMAGFVGTLISKSQSGAELVFGPLANPGTMATAFGPENSFILAFAGTGLIAIIFFSALMAILYHMGIMQLLVWLLARVMSVTMGVSGAEAMAVAANVFVGQTEAPLVVRPYLPKMTMSELNALMTGGFATIAGSVLAVYMGFLGEELGPHLLTASVLSAPAAFLIAKIMRPETEEPATSGKVKLKIERQASNVIEAAANGTTDGLKLWLNVIAMLIAFTALVAFANWPLESLGLQLTEWGWANFNPELGGRSLSLSLIFGWVFAPVAWAIGVDGWADCQLFGSLLGTKVSINEFVAFSEMLSYVPGSGSDVVFQSERTAKMAAYALCGFANFASIGIQIGGISPLAPDRKTDLSRLAVRAMIGGAFASWMTASVAGMFL